MSDNAPKLWQQLDTDTPKSWEAFCVYRDMGSERTLTKAAEVLGKSATIVERWSSQHGWVERATAYDANLAEKNREVLEKARVKVRKDALDYYDFMQRFIQKRIDTLTDADYRSSIRDILDLQTLAERVNKMVRLNVGLPDEIKQQHTEVSGKDGTDLVIKVIRGDDANG